ncbi:MAG: type II toxin-antitoxin system VapC family toxin [Deltaproteobacteria bacterium]|nr:type II toxin-antitoxin system VapC family toxin [Deltaproteobacteria bacterium]
MRFLLDTHALLWWLFDAPELSKTARELVADPANEIRVSAASAWEVSTKYRLGKLPAARELMQDLGGWLQRAGFQELPITISHAHQAGAWPQAHRDPFDRMLAAQSALEDLPLISRDPKLAPFGIRLVW